MDKIQFHHIIVKLFSVQHSQIFHFILCSSWKMLTKLIESNNKNERRKKENEKSTVTLHFINAQWENDVRDLSSMQMANEKSRKTNPVSTDLCTAINLCDLNYFHCFPFSIILFMVSVTNSIVWRLNYTRWIYS